MAHDTLPGRIENECMQLKMVLGGILTGALLSAIIVYHALTI
jgi:hypothetical protein